MSLGIWGWIGQGLLWVVVVVQGLVLLELMRQVGILRMQQPDKAGALVVEGDGLDRGAVAPPFQAKDLVTGGLIDSSALASGKSLLVFLTTRCQSCRELIPSLNEVIRDRHREIEIYAVCSSPTKGQGECEALASEFNPRIHVLFDPAQQLSEVFRVRRTPGATLIIDGRVRVHAIPNNREQIDLLLDEEVSFVGGGWQTVGDGEELRMAG